MVRPVNEHDSVLFRDSIEQLADFASLMSLDLSGSYFTLDSGFDSDYNTWLIRSYDMVPVIKPNRRGTKDEKKIAAMYEHFNEPLYRERFKIERVFAWQDTYRKLAHSYERLTATRIGLKYLGYALMNLRAFVGNSV